MARKIFVYNNDKNSMEVYYKNEWETMPYVTNNTLSVREFMGSTNSPTIWTDKRVMECWNTLRRLWGRPIYVGFAFKRIWEGGHGAQSQHYAGTAMDMAQTFSNQDRNRLRQLATDIGCWVYVEPAYLTPTWVHVDRRLQPPACAAGYVELKNGDINTNVLVLQDALNTLGFTGGGFDGIFGSGTEAALKRYQTSRGINPSGVTDCVTWTTITREVKGKGKSNTTIL